MKKIFNSLFIALTIALIMPIVSCAGADEELVDWNIMHYFYAEYGQGNEDKAMIRSYEDSNVAILATSESGNIRESSFVQLTKTKTGNTYTFEGSKDGTTYSLKGQLSTVPNGISNDSFTILDSSEAMQNLGFIVGKSIHHWTEKKTSSIY